jgi:putative membrane protein
MPLLAMTPLLHSDGWSHPWVWPLVPLAWLAALVLLFRFVVWRWRPRPASGTDRARDILAERYARGDIELDEYRERLDRLGA